MQRRCIVVWRVQRGAGRGTDGASTAQAIALFEVGVVSTWWAFCRDWVALEMNKSSRRSTWEPKCTGQHAEVSLSYKARKASTLQELQCFDQ